MKIIALLCFVCCISISSGLQNVMHSGNKYDSLVRKMRSQESSKELQWLLPLKLGFNKVKIAKSIYISNNIINGDNVICHSAHSDTHFEKLNSETDTTKSAYYIVFLDSCEHKGDFIKGNIHRVNCSFKQLELLKWNSNRIKQFPNISFTYVVSNDSICYSRWVP